MRRGARGRRRLGVAGALALPVLVAVACGSAPTESPEALLAGAGRQTAAATSAHFVLTSQGATGSGTDVTGGDGDIARPDVLRGTFRVRVLGLQVSVKVLAAQGRFFAEAPFQTTYAATDPAKFGLANPATLLDPRAGLSGLLAHIEDPRGGGRMRIDGEVVDAVNGTVPGTQIPAVLPDSDPARPVAVTALIDPTSHELRRFVLTGPFTAATDSTYTVTLTGYGEPVHVALPG